MKKGKGKKLIVETVIEFMKWLFYPFIFILYLTLLNTQPENKIINFILLTIIFLAILFIVNYIKESLIEVKK